MIIDDLSKFEINNTLEICPSQVNFHTVYDWSKCEHCAGHFFDKIMLKNKGNAHFNIVEVIGTNSTIHLTFNESMVFPGQEVGLNLYIKTDSTIKSFSNTIYVVTDANGETKIPITFFGNKL